MWIFAQESYSPDDVDVTILPHGGIYRNKILSGLNDDSNEFLCNLHMVVHWNQHHIKIVDDFYDEKKQ